MLTLDRTTVTKLALERLVRASDDTITTTMQGWRAPELGLVITEHFHSKDTLSWGSEILHRGPHGVVTAIELPRGHRIPLHDHPGMNGFMRVLLGRLRVSTYRRHGDEAELVDDRTLDVHDPVFPVTARGELHALVAIDRAVFVDVLRPPYTAERPCTYWRLAGPGPRFALSAG